MSKLASAKFLFTSFQAVPSSEWFNIGLTFGTVSGLKVFYGGRLNCEDSVTSEVPAATAPESQLVLGVTSDDNVTAAFDWEVAGVTLWNEELLSGHLGKLIGTTGMCA